MAEVKSGESGLGPESEDGETESNEVIESCRSGLNLITSLSTRERCSEWREFEASSALNDNGGALRLALCARDLQHALFNLALNAEPIGQWIRR